MKMSFIERFVSLNESSPEAAKRCQLVDRLLERHKPYDIPSYDSVNSAVGRNIYMFARRLEMS